MASRAGCARPGYGHGLDEDKDEAAAMDPDRKKPWREGKCVDVWECKYNIKDSTSAQNIGVAFYREYSRYCYLYFTTGKQWSKDLLNNNKGIFINILA
jgi:hypothetical protein